MSAAKRYILIVTGVLVMVTSSGCFLWPFGGGEDSETEIAIDAAARLREKQMEAEEALFQADMAIEEERFDAAVLEFNRAIRADSSNVGIYFELAKLHQELATLYREDGDLETAIQHNARGLKVLEDLMGYQKRNLDTAAAGEMQVDRMPPDDMGEAVPDETSPVQETAEPETEDSGFW